VSLRRNVDVVTADRSSVTMPKAVKQKGYPQTVIDEILKPDNRELVTAIGVFAVSLQELVAVAQQLTCLMQAAVTVLHLGWAEFLLVV
jgi:hypothetical protein